MFQEFQPRFDRRAAWLFVASLGIASAMLGGLLVAIQVLAEAEPDAPEEQIEEEVIVEFARPSDVEEEPEPIEEETVEPLEATEVFRPAAARPTIAPPPDEIPDERPQESDGELAEAEASGPTGGDIRGVVGGMGGGRVGEGRRPPPPPPPPAPTMMRERGRSGGIIRREQIAAGRPRFSCPAPPQARSQGLFGTVVVQVVVDASGKNTRYDILRAPNDVLRDATRQCLRANWQRWRPATLNGRPLEHAWRQPFTYRATNI
ncbi:MAG: energy transducer TonB [Myxococcota bacterium]